MPDVVASLTIVDGNNQTGVVNTNFAKSLTVVAKDQYGNVVPGATVTTSVTPTSGGAGATVTGTTTTDTSGQVSLTAKANTKTGGPYTVTVTSNGKSVSFSLTNTPGPAANLAVVSGTPQTVGVTATTAALVVVVTDAFGNVVQGATVNYSAPSSGASATVPATATSGSTGQASVTATANTVAGAYSVTASLGGASPVTFALTNTAGAATNLSVVSGTPQSVVVGGASTPLIALVTDTHGNPVSGVTVSFTAPASSATSSVPPTATTGSDGKASVTATSNHTAGGPYAVTASITGGAAPVSFWLTNTAGAPATVAVVSGDNQSASVNNAFPSPLVVVVKDQYGNVVPGAAVTFTGPGSGASAGISGTATTDAQGQVSVTATANGSVGGPYTVTATAGSATSAPFHLTNTAGVAAKLELISGDAQQAQVTAAFAAPLVVGVYDANDFPVSNATVAFTPPSAGATASLSATSLSTDAQGRAQVSATANTTAGAFQVSVALPGASAVTPVVFSLTNLPGAAVGLQVVSGSVQSTTVSTDFSAPLVVEAVDAWGNPVPGAHVTWTPPSSGAGAIPSSTDVVTDANGRATITAKANSLPGTYPLTAKLPGGQQADFVLTNVATNAPTIVVASGSPQTSVVGAAFGAPLVVLVSQGGTPVANATVTFVAPTSGPTAALSAVTANTDATGHAQVLATAGHQAGSYQISAVLAGTTQPAAFSLTNTAGAPTSIVTSPGASPQSAKEGSDFGVPLVVTVVDQYGNPVPGVSVTFTPPSSGPTATLSGATLTTDANGQATVTATAGGSDGTYTVTATAAGVSGHGDFTLTNSPTSPVFIAVVSGTPQSSTVGTAFTLPLVVVVKDATGTVVPNAVVNWAVPTAGASGSLPASTATTDSQGQASITVTAGHAAGRFDVQASLTGGAAPAVFELTNTAGAPTSVTALATATPQSTRVTTAFALPLGVVVKDQYSNPVSGVAVTYAVAAAGASCTLTATPPATDAQGQASVVAIANSQQGTYTATATVSGVAAPARFDLTNLSGTASTISLVSGDGQVTMATTDFTNPVVVQVNDAWGNPAQGATVTVSVPSTGPSATLTPAAPVTDVNGQASVRLTANDVPGGFNAALSAGTATPVGARFTITAIPTTTTVVVADGGTSIDHTPVLTATVTATKGTPTGVVRFLVDGAEVGTGSLDQGTASLSPAAPALGAHTVVAVYDAQGAFGASTSAEAGLTITHDSGHLSGSGGCGAAPGQASGSWLLLAAVGLWLLARRRSRGLALGALLLLAPGAARAQSTSTGGASIDTFHTAVAGSDWFSTDSLDFRGHLRPALRLLADYAHDPLVAYNGDGSWRSVALQNQLWLNLGGSLNFFDRLRISANLPVAVYQSAKASTFNGVRIDPTGKAGLGDITLGADLRLIGTYDDAFTLAAGATVTLPTGSATNLMGDGRLGVTPHAALAGNVGIFAWAAQVGYAFRAGQIADIAFNNELRFGASAGLRLFEKKLLIGPEFFGTADLGPSAGEARPAALELDLGAHYRFHPDWRAGVGLGTGLTRSPGSPNVRALAMVQWEPAFVPVPEKPSDLDGDGIIDAEDACPLDPGPATRDPATNGCPPPKDRDHDGIADDVDVCPDTPKGAHPDPDHLGCPDKDTDHDGLLDHDDLCPTEPMGAHPDATRRGCPDKDTDHDGVFDSVDQCPTEPSGLLPDPNKPGCPLPDRDGDKVADAVDACPDKPGAPDPDPKKNGCPGLVQMSGEKIMIMQPVNFATNKDVILPSSDPVLKAVAQTLKAFPAIERLAVHGHTDSQGKADYNLELSERRAKSVMKWLVDHGIAEERLEAHGFGQTKPIDDNKSAKGRANNRRVEFIILKQSN
jgi:outer membrane protein OmpA-like peptidoglycan-associated protein